MHGLWREREGRQITLVHTELHKAREVQLSICHEHNLKCGEDDDVDHDSITS